MSDSDSELAGPGDPFGEIEWSRKATRFFISAYKAQPALWNVNCEAYKDRNRRKFALKEMLFGLKGRIPFLTIESVKKKINTLRSQYRRERRRIIKTRKDSTQADELYRPTLWCFRELEFLAECNDEISSLILAPPEESEVWAEPLDIKDESIENIVLEQQPRLFFEQPMHSTFSSEEPKLPSQNENDGIDGTLSVVESSRPTIEQPLVSMEPDIPRQKTSENLNDSVSILGLVSKLLQNPRPEDTCDIVGKSVAAKLKEVSKDQRIYAERLISEVLFEAELGNLSRECSVNVPRYKQNSRNSTYDGELHSEKNKKLKTI